MRYFIALLCPPLAILMCGHFFLFLLSIPLTAFYFPGALLALLVVANYYERTKYDRMIDSVAAFTVTAIQAPMIEAEKARRERDVHAHAEMRALHDLVYGPGHSSQVASDQVGPGVVFAAWLIIFLVKLPFRMAILSYHLVKLLVILIRYGTPVAWNAGVRAYQSLPEWAQPISWGLAAGTPISIAVGVAMAWRR